MCGTLVQGNESSGSWCRDCWWDGPMDQFDAAKGSFGGKLEQVYGQPG